LSYPKPPEANADVDDEGEIDISVSLDVDVDVDIDVDAALDADDGGGHDVEAVFEDDAVDGDSSDDEVDDADPLQPFHPGFFSGNDSVVETLRLYGDVRKDPKCRIISQGGEGDAFHVDYEELNKKLSRGDSRFCVTLFHLHSIFYSLSHFSFVIYISSNRKPVRLLSCESNDCTLHHVEEDFLERVGDGFAWLVQCTGLWRNNL
jgi:hypothetical protein